MKTRHRAKGQEGEEDDGSDEAQGHEGRRRAKGQEGHEEKSREKVKAAPKAKAMKYGGE